jgi:hypothetical protein
MGIVSEELRFGSGAFACLTHGLHRGEGGDDHADERGARPEALF